MTKCSCSKAWACISSHRGTNTHFNNIPVRVNQAFCLSVPLMNQAKQGFYFVVCMHAFDCKLLSDLPFGITSVSNSKTPPPPFFIWARWMSKITSTLKANFCFLQRVLISRKNVTWQVLMLILLLARHFLFWLNVWGIHGIHMQAANNLLPKNPMFLSNHICS